MKSIIISTIILLSILLLPQDSYSCANAILPKNLNDCKDLNATAIIGRKSYCCFFEMKKPRQATSCIPVEDFIFLESKIIKNANISFPGNLTINGDITCSSVTLTFIQVLISLMIIVILF